MKDGAMKACVGMAFVFGTYAVYMGSHVLAGQEVPDGVLFGTVVASVTGLAGFAVGKKA